MKDKITDLILTRRRAGYKENGYKLICSRMPTFFVGENSWGNLPYWKQLRTNVDLIQQVVGEIIFMK